MSIHSLYICVGMFRAAVPSGASTGIYEALEMRDKIPQEYHGKGNAIFHVEHEWLLSTDNHLNIAYV